MEGYRRTGGLEQDQIPPTSLGAIVWKVTAEQADWNTQAARSRDKAEEFGRLPPNRRIGTSNRFQNRCGFTSLEGYRRTGGLERRLWGLTACAERFGRLPPNRRIGTPGPWPGSRKYSEFGRLPPNRRIGTRMATNTTFLPSLEGYRRTGGLECVLWLLLQNWEFGRLPPNRRIGTGVKWL